MQDPKTRQKSPYEHHPTILSGYFFASKTHIDNRKKKLVKQQNLLHMYPHNMVNFGLLAAEIVSLVWGTPANFNGFRVLATLLHGTPILGVSQTAALNRGRHLYLAGRPSRWALAHISSSSSSFFFLFSSRNLSRRRLDVCHTSTHSVALVRI